MCLRHRVWDAAHFLRQAQDSVLFHLKALTRRVEPVDMAALDRLAQPVLHRPRLLVMPPLLQGGWIISNVFNLGVTYRTVSFHLESILNKLEVQIRPQAITWINQNMSDNL